MKSAKHAGDAAVAVSKAYGVETMFTLSGGHVFPLYDGAQHEGVRILDVRHEQSAVFAAEASARLTRTPGLAVLTAGPGITNGVSGVATAHANGSPVVIMGGRAPQSRWGSGALQEMDHPPLLAPITKLAFTASGADSVSQDVEMAFRTAVAPHRGPVFLDFHMDHLFAPSPVHETQTQSPSPLEPDRDDLRAIAKLLAEAERPVLVYGSDVWMDRAEEAARDFAETWRLPVIPNGQGRGILPTGHELLVTRARGDAFAQADLVVVIGTPLDFRLGYGWFGGKDGAPLAKVVHIADAPSHLTTHMRPVASAAGFSLMDVDTLVRHRLPVVMICGNNGIWGLEKHPMQLLYGYDVAAELQPQCRYDQVVTALGGGGELVTKPSEIGPALRRAFDSGIPYMVNIATDPAIAYPRNTTGV